MMNLLLSIALLSMLVSVSAAQALTPSMTDRIKTVANESLKSSNSGLAVVLIENCAVSWHGDFGFANKAEGRLVDPHTRFQFGSMSKTVTAWAIMTLVERGKIELDQPVNKYLKSWKLESAQFDASEVTVRRVLQHLAGLSVPSVSGVDAGTPVPRLVDELSGKLPATTAVAIVEKPGTKFTYSGGGYALLQLLIEDVTGTTFEKYVTKMIFKPLQMASATFSPDHKSFSQTATPYDASGNPLKFRVFAAQAAAGLYATVDDYAKFVIAQCSATQKVLKPETRAAMFSGEGVAARYGLGYELLPKINANPIVSHSGSNFGWKANFFVFPVEGDGIVVATNSDTQEPRRKIIGIWRDAVVAKYRRAP